MVRDVANARQSIVVTPTIDFGTLFSRYTYIAASLGADLRGSSSQWLATVGLAYTW